MKVTFIKCSLSDLEELMSEYQGLLSSPMDSFLEDHIIASEHFLIYLGEEKIGYTSIHNRELLTQFYIRRGYRYLGQEIFSQVKKLENVNCASVSTGDEFFLSHALDEYRSMKKQAYFFKDSNDLVDRNKMVSGLSMKLAKSLDTDMILEYSGDFFDNLSQNISDGNIYIVRRNGAIAGFGIIEKGRIMKGYASIGMYTVDKFRQMGIGRSILLMLKEIVYKNNLRPIAGCWYYNHNSKKTLESAGMYSDTRLLKIHY